jgi:predicted choloylglycine hydrolase
MKLLIYLNCFICISCTKYFIEVDNNFENFERNFFAIDTEGKISIQKVNIKSKTFFYFFDSSCPRCWQIFENVSKTLESNTNNIEFCFFIYNYDFDSLNYCINNKLHNSIFLIETLPINIKKNTLYLYSNKKVFIFTDILEVNKISNKMINNLLSGK